jgi:hypothetical protein
MPPHWNAANKTANNRSARLNLAITFESNCVKRREQVDAAEFASLIAVWVCDFIADARRSDGRGFGDKHWRYLRHKRTLRCTPFWLIPLEMRGLQSWLVPSFLPQIPGENNGTFEPSSPCQEMFDSAYYLLKICGHKPSPKNFKID